MFNKNLGTCQLTDDVSNQMFANIIGITNWHFKRDYSLLALTRALLYKRLTPEDGTFAVRIRNKDYAGITVGRVTPSVLLNDMTSANDISQSILLCNLCCPAEKISEIFDVMDKNFGSWAIGYREAADLRQFVGQYNINARFFCSDERKATVIVVDNMELRSYHFLISLLPRYIRWYLKDKPLDLEEIQLCKSFTESYPLKCERMLTEVCKRIDFRAFNIKRLIGGFERRNRERQAIDAERQLNETNSRIENNVSLYRQLIRQRDDDRIKLEGIRSMINNASDNSELIQFLMNAKYIDVRDARGSSLTVVIQSYLDVFDPAVSMRMLNNSRSVLLDYYDVSDNNEVFRDIEKRKKLLTAIFSDDPVLKIKTCASFEIDLRGEVYANGEYTYPDEYQDVEPNPHLDRYNCLGQNRGVMCERLIAGDVVGCLMQCVASTKCLNFADTTVIAYFAKKLFNGSRKIIELPDHTSATIVEALAWLEKQEEEAAE